MSPNKGNLHKRLPKFNLKFSNREDLPNGIVRCHFRTQILPRQSWLRRPPRTGPAQRSSRSTLASTCNVRDRSRVRSPFRRPTAQPLDKHVVLGLIFLKYISDAFESRRKALAEELKADGIEGAQADQLLENRDEYTAEGVFWVPPEARWANIQNQGKQPNIATLIDDAMHAIERDNPKLKGKLPRDYARRGISPERLGTLIDQIASIAIGTDQAKSKDVLGRVYEYFLGKFAAAEGKLGGGVLHAQFRRSPAGRDDRTL
jgi:hypothetical protein